MEKVKIKDKEYYIHEGDVNALLVLAISELTEQIKRLVNHG